MAGNAQDTLYNIFAALSQGSGGSVGGGLAGAAAQAAKSSGSSSGKGSGGAGSSAGSTVTSVLKNSSGLLGLVWSVVDFFGGGGSEEPPPLVKYALPPAQSFEAADTGSGFAGADYDQAGMPRAFAPAPSAKANAAPTQPQVNVTVQAMDARSFLDRSTEIAAAVREAMLNLNSINDVVNDL